MVKGSPGDAIISAHRLAMNPSVCLGRGAAELRSGQTVGPSLSILCLTEKGRGAFRLSSVAVAWLGGYLDSAVSRSSSF